MNRNKALTGGIALACIAITGCGVKPRTASQAATEAPLILSPTQRSQEQARVMQAIGPMSPEQRAAYFKAHPEDVAVMEQ